MANVSVMAADNVNPAPAIKLNTTNDEVGRVNVFAVDLVYGDFATAANTYVLGKIAVGSIITHVTCVVPSAWNDGFDLGISDIDGTAGTDELFDTSNVIGRFPATIPTAIAAKLPDDVLYDRVT